MLSGELLEEFIDELIEYERNERLKEILGENMWYTEIQLILRILLRLSKTIRYFLNALYLIL